jgi:hypothetical protein
MNPFRASAFVLVAIIFLASLASAGPLPDTTSLPSSLDSWKPWVLHGLEENFCPTPYNDSETHYCTWPSRLSLDLQDHRARFTQEWVVFKKDRVSLPGSPELWPSEVTMDARPAPVGEKDQVPSVLLLPGSHRVEGFFLWDKMPDMIQLPRETGLVSVTLNGSPVPFPFIDEGGRLWLKAREGTLREEDRVEVRAFRLLRDMIPLEVITLLRVNISGQAREIALGPILLENTVPTRIESALPAKCGPQGELILQGRPGQWEVVVSSRCQGQVHALAPARLVGDEEIWAFEPQNHLRIVKIEGVPAVDPKQTDVPPQWQRFSTFLIRPQGKMVFKEIRRGDPDPAPDQINLARTWWLDFDGRGLTAQDQLTGTLSRQWYLAMNPPAVLGRVSVDGIDQLITGHGKEKKPGVELRRGALTLLAESRLEGSPRTLSAVGWDHDVQSLSGTLHLPPGWKLLAAPGADVATGTWFERWSLLDLFLVLIISLGVYKLWTWCWGLLALIALALTFHEPDAPRLVWLNLLAAAALLRLLPEGWCARLVKCWRWTALVFLLVLSLPFMVQQIRWGVYPQLEGGETVALGGHVLEKKAMRANFPPPLSAPVPTPSMEAPSDHEKAGRMFAESTLKEEVRPQAVQTLDPNALNQTGPGIPSWTWRTASFIKWNGPVTKEQTLRLWLLSPGVNLVLAFLRVILLALMISLFIDIRGWRAFKPAASLGGILVFLLCLSSNCFAETASYPPPEILEQLKQRLLEKPECFPRCAESPRIEVTAATDSLRILFQVHAAVETAVPLPCSLGTWAPQQVLLNASPAQALFKDNQGLLWALIPEGVHTVTLVGPIPRTGPLQIPLPLKPRQGKVIAEGWNVQGVRPDGSVETTILLTRAAAQVADQEGTPEISIPPFFRLERSISLGLRWTVTTIVTRTTLADRPVSLSVPLLEGESLTTPGISVDKGRALISMNPGQKRITWTSTLKELSPINLEAPLDVPWMEHWSLDASPIWHCAPSGIAMVHHQSHDGYWKPTWQPWPGERVAVAVTRPQPVTGQVVTIEEAALELSPGERYTNATLRLQIRTSKGDQHRITLPAGATVLEVNINGTGQPIRQEGNDLIVPLQPGFQTIAITWHLQSAASLFFKSPPLKVGDQAVNATVTFHLPENRWILFTGGPRLGPAVLFWSYLVVTILAAFGLGRLTSTPLRTRHWLLLGLGLTQVHPLAALVVVGWLLVLGQRKESPPKGRPLFFNLGQLILVVWTVVALACLYYAVQEGLLGIPNMQVAGNGSTNFLLNWTQDRIGALMPQPWVLSLPVMVFRILMLLWALWLAASLLKWLRWGWQCFGEGGWWKRKARKEPAPAVTPSPLP